jgi:23S rRNA pseudouridine2605 synthase
MRINQFIAAATGLSRRAADHAIQEGRVRVNGQRAELGKVIQPGEKVSLDGKPLAAPEKTQTIMLNKPYGYVCSRAGQGSKTIYDLLPANLHHLKPVGRLDRESTGLLLMTNNGQLVQDMTHPSKIKQKVYQVELSQPLDKTDQFEVERGVTLEDGLSSLMLKGADRKWQVTMHEGRNRQIRRTFAARGYKVLKLHRSQFGEYAIGGLAVGKFREI